MSDDDLDKFRRFAGECLRLAERFQSVDDRAVLLSMAQVWIRLADQGQKIRRLVGEDGAQRQRDLP
jgi:hypothetical protein